MCICGLDQCFSNFFLSSTDEPLRYCSKITSRLTGEGGCDSPNTKKISVWKIYDKGGGEVKKVDFIRDVIYE